MAKEPPQDRRIPITQFEQKDKAQSERIPEPYRTLSQLLSETAFALGRRGSTCGSFSILLCIMDNLRFGSRWLHSGQVVLNDN